MAKYQYDEIGVYKKRIIPRWILLLLILLLIVVGTVHFIKLPPPGTSIEGSVYLIPGTSITFLNDRTYINKEGNRIVEQEIFDEVFSMINEAHEHIVMDMFLFNDFQGTVQEDHRALSSEMVNALVVKKNKNPNINITVVTDPINNLYGGITSAQLNALEQAGINLIITDLKPLRDSNPIYSSIWRVFFSWLGNNDKPGIVPNPLSAHEQKVSIRTYLSLLNFKANHRKVLIADRTVGSIQKFSTLITSGNPHNGSSAHDNIALRVDDALWWDVLKSEQAVATFSSRTIPSIDREKISDIEGLVSVQLLTEGKIKDKLLTLLQGTESGDEIEMVMFYLSDRDVVAELKKASHRGVAIRLILDPNKDAFGRTKNGVPNRPVAKELKKKTPINMEIRWCQTHGEQCHSKVTRIQSGDTNYLLLGSANLTRRNIGDYNLETNVLVNSKSFVPAIKDAADYFSTLWNNEGGIYTTEYETYQDETMYKTVQYHIMERSGLSTF